MDFYINRSSGDNLHLQIRKQIEYRIATGELRAGDRLPTIRELEGQLGVNRHTIRRAYLDLEKQGLLRVQRGSGVTVAAGPSDVDRRRRDPAIDELIETTLLEAAKRGHSPVAFSRMMGQKALEMDRRRPSLAFVECSDNQARDLAAALEAHLGQAVIGIGLSDIKENASGVPESVQYVVVPVFHTNEVREALRGRDLQILTVRVEVGGQFRSQTAKLLPAERPCVILRDREAIPLYPELVRRIAGLESGVVPVLMRNREKVERIVEESDLVFYSPPCRRFAEEAVPDGKKMQEIVFEFTPDALELVKRSIGV